MSSPTTPDNISEHSEENPYAQSSREQNEVIRAAPHQFDTMSSSNISASAASNNAAATPSSNGEAETIRGIYQALMKMIEQQQEPKPVPVVLPMTPLPDPGTTSNPFFVGKNITAHIKRFEVLCRNHKVPTEDNDEELCRLFSTTIYETLSPTADSLPGSGFVEGQKANWELFKKSLKLQFFGDDELQRMGTMEFVDVLCSWRRGEDDDIQTLLQSFRTAILQQSPQMEETEKVRKLSQAVPRSWQLRTWRRCGIDWRRVETYRCYDKFIESIEMEISVQESGKFQDNSSTSNKALVKRLENAKEPAPPTVDPVITHHGVIPAAAPANPDMEGLTKAIAQLSINVQSMNTEKGALPLRPPTLAIMPGQVDAETADHMDVYAATVHPSLAGRCWMCGDQGHFSNECGFMAFLISKGLVHKDGNRWCYGTTGNERIEYQWDKETPRGYYLLNALEKKRGPLDLSDFVGIDTRRAHWERCYKKARGIPLDQSIGAHFGALDVEAYAARAAVPKKPANPASRPAAAVPKGVIKQRAPTPDKAAQTRAVRFQEEPSFPTAEDVAASKMAEISKEPEKESQTQEGNPIAGSSEATVAPNPGPATPNASPAAGAVTAPVKKKKREPQTKSWKHYMQEHLGGDGMLFWDDTILSSRISITYGDLIVHGPDLKRALRDRVKNDAALADQLRAYAAKKGARLELGAHSGVLGEIDSDDEVEPEKDEEEHAPQTQDPNGVYANDGKGEVECRPSLSEIQAMFARARPATVIESSKRADPRILYEDTDGIDLSAVECSYARVPGTYVTAKMGPHKKPVQALLDDGCEAMVMSVNTFRELGLGMVSTNFKLRGAGGLTDFVGAVKNVDVDVFGVNFQFDFFIASQPDLPTLFGRPWSRKCRLISANCDDGSWEGQIADMEGNTVVFSGNVGNAGCWTSAQLEGKDPVSRF